MPNSLKTRLSKLRYKRQITNEEYQELIAKLDGHDKVILTDAIRKFAEWLECSGLNYDEEEAFWCRTHFDGKIFAEEVYTTNELLNLYEKEKEK